MSKLVRVLLCLCLMSATQLFAEAGDDVTFLLIAPFNARTNVAWSPMLKDIVQHEAPGDHNSYTDLVTLGHETSHGIHSYIRNKMNDTGKRVNGFYVLNNRAAVIEEPPIRKRQIATYIPKNLRGSRYDLYITGQTSWDDTPLYIWDEWNAYVNGGAVGVDLVENNQWNTGWRDAVAGPLEFNVYAIATAMAVEKLAPAYFGANTQFREFLAYNLKRSFEIFRKGREMPQFKWDKQDAYYELLKTSPEAEPIRDFINRVFGEEWSQEVLGF